MQELKAHGLPGLFGIVMPTLVAAVLAPLADVALLVETAIWAPEALTCKTVIGTRHGQPVSLMDDLVVPAGYVVIYGRTAEDAREAATEHAHRMSAALIEERAYFEALEEVGQRVGAARADVELATEAYKAALAEATR